MNDQLRPIAIYYEHQNWFRPLFDELDRRGVPYVRIDARQHQYDTAASDSEYALFFNRMSPSAYRRGNAQGILYTLSYLAHLERQGVRVVNGYRAFSFEISKAMQLSLLEQLGLQYPRARVINHPAQAPSAAQEIGFPLLVKPNIGGSGAGIVRFDTPEALEAAVWQGQLDLGLDQTALVQEYIPARDGAIIRVEVLGGKYLYAIQVFLSGDTFDLCPADICKAADGTELVRTACAVDAPKTGLRVQGYNPPSDVIHNVERIMHAAGIEVGGVEYIVDARDARLLYYDINALSNFVADGPRVIGFNPYARLADYLVAESRIAVVA